jgi:hypothetical protein
MNIDFTTTACNRPKLLRQTYESFENSLVDVDFSQCTLHINIDPAPGQKGRERVLAAAQDFFGTVNYRMPESASFSDAVRWTWSQVETPLFFNLEDDWKLQRDVRLQVLVNEFKRVPEQYLQIILRHSPAHGPHDVSNKPRMERIKKPGLPPMVANTALMWPVVERFDTNMNPEKWLRKWYRETSPNANPYMWPEEPITQDAGREWRADRNLAKNRIEGAEPGNWDTWTKQ